MAAAKVAQIHDSILSFPNGYSTLLGERGINLSGGQKQRTTLARALARDPFVLILDDALSAVDTHTEAKILEDLKTVLAGRTSFIISHRVSAVMNADQILVLDGRADRREGHPCGPPGSWRDLRRPPPATDAGGGAGGGGGGRLPQIRFMMKSGVNRVRYPLRVLKVPVTRKRPRTTRRTPDIS